MTRCIVYDTSIIGFRFNRFSGATEEGKSMPNQRTLVLLEPPIKNLIKQIAKANGTSISNTCRDLIREALEIYEDRYWNAAASAREKGFNWKKGLTHEQVWKKAKKLS